MWNFERGLAKVVGMMLHRELKAGVRAVYLEGKFPPPPFVLAMNHHSYFDGHLVYLLFRSFGFRGKLLISPENVAAFPIFRPLGALEASRVRAALQALGAGEVVAVFPEGDLRCHGKLGELKRGAVFLAQKARVPLVPCAARLFPRGFPRPEIYIWIGDPVDPDLGALRVALERMLSAMDELVEKTHPREPIPGFHPLFTGHRGLDEQMAGISRALGRFLR
ncbi:MAG: Phospholipid/glycerol acyltransferase [Acetothermia bacterium 64_32]|nr:MAG: Phospholipid/glycerol acyltransferase [Acetothermia bacterium 64_32]HAF70625.1 1-acyl-sn-glycerol-3-phosphate acyltransferase [Candidatus Acetothermia bacterium]